MPGGDLRGVLPRRSELQRLLSRGRLVLRALHVRRGRPAGLPRRLDGPQLHGRRVHAELRVYLPQRRYVAQRRLCRRADDDLGRSDYNRRRGYDYRRGDDGNFHGDDDAVAHPATDSVHKEHASFFELESR